MPREELSEVRFSSRNELGFIPNSIEDEDANLLNGKDEVRGPTGVIYKVIKETDPMPCKQHESVMRKKETEL